VTDNRILKLKGLWRIVAVLTFVMATVVVSSGSASAYSASANQSVQAQKAAVTTAADPAAVPHATIAGCAFLNFCAYPGTNFGGNPIRMVACGRDVFIPFVGNGSWINNQTSGTRARFKDVNHHVIATTAGAFSASTSQNWSPVFYVQAC
jgi:hypothetical protein